MSSWLIVRGIRNLRNPAGKRVLNSYIYMWLAGRHQRQVDAVISEARTRRMVLIDAWISLASGIAMLAIFIASYVYFGKSG